MLEKRLLPYVLAALGGGFIVYLLLTLFHGAPDTGAVTTPTVLEQDVVQPGIGGAKQSVTGQTGMKHPEQENNELARLQQQVDALTRAVQELSRGRTGTESGFSDMDDDTRNLQREETMQAAALQLQASHETWDTQLLNEAPDPVWTTESVAQIQNDFMSDTALAGGQLLDARCGSTLCRVEVMTNSGGRDGEPAEDLEDILQMKWAARFAGGSMKTITEPDGSRRVVVYYARKGHQLIPPQVSGSR